MEKEEGYIPQILKQGRIILSKHESKGWVDLIRLVSLAPNSKCCDYPIHLSDTGITCTYCGELCEINER